MRRVLKWDVQVDDHNHQIGGGAVAHVECQYDHRSVQVWTLEEDDIDVFRVAQAFGTGQPLPVEAGAHLGSVVTADGALVWHLFEMDAPSGSQP